MPSKTETYSSEEEEGKEDPYADKSLEELEAELHKLQTSDPNEPQDWGVTSKEHDDGNQGIPDCMLYGKNWTFRGIYLAMNIFLVTLLATTPNTAMWTHDGTIDVPYLSGFAIYMSVTWVFYLLVQGSDPGFIDQEEYQSSNIARLEEGKVTNLKNLKDAHPIPAGNMEVKLTVTRKPKGQRMQPDRGDDEEEKQELEDEEIEVELHEPEEEDEIDLNDPAEDEDDDSAAFLAWKEWPPMRAGYCKAAKRWVAMYDHFCPFLNTPIGERNHCRFWWFLFFQTISLCWGISLCHTGFIEHQWDGGAWMSVNGHALWAAVLLYLMMLFVGPLFLFHTFLALTNITTFEFMRASEVDYLKGTQDFDLPFASSFCFNLRFFCCEQDAFTRWLCIDTGCVAESTKLQKGRGWTPRRWQRPKAIVRDSDDWYNHMWQNKYWSCC